jgi:ring-1,2-phenylacetyl-CoA epoxidase subunit PaaD
MGFAATLRRLHHVSERNPSLTRVFRGAALADVWRALGTVVDPEIPVVSIVELGIVRSVEREADRVVVTVTPTYSGCPATRVIEQDIRAAVEARVGDVPEVVTALAPAWTTDWIAPEARSKLNGAGIAPPGPAPVASQATIRFTQKAIVRCPNCGSTRTTELARFGSTRRSTAAPTASSRSTISRRTDGPA